MIREDPVNPNLLFAGTEFGLFVTFDRGASWHRVKNGLPTVPVFDLQIHPRDHDLILATHGRSIWIMDDISALEEMNTQTLTTDLKIVGTRPGIQWKMADYRGFMGTSNFLAPNAPAGLTVDYFTKSAGPVRATITDASGGAVRTLNARAEANVVNRLTWDMRYDAPVPPAGGGAAAAAGGGRGGRGGGGGRAAGGGRAGRGGAAAAAGAPPTTTSPSTGEAQTGAGLAGELNAEFGAEAAAGRGGAEAAAGRGGGGRGGRGGGAPLVDPGKYTITLTAGNAKDSMAIEVEDDPRVQMSNEDRAKKRQTIQTLVTMIKEAEEPRRKAVGMTTAMTNLLASWQAPNAAPVPEGVRKAVEDFNARLRTAAAVFEAAGGGRGGRGGGGGGAGPPAGYTPPPVTQKITQLMGQIDAYSAPPTSKQMQDLAEDQTELKSGVGEINTLWDEMPKLNKVMTDAGMQYFKVEMSNAPAAAFGRGGGN